MKSNDSRATLRNTVELYHLWVILIQVDILCMPLNPNHLKEPFKCLHIYLKMEWNVLGFLWEARSSGLSIYYIHKDTGYSSFAQSARKWGCLQGRNAYKRGTYVLDMFPEGTAQNWWCCACFRASSSDLEHTSHWQAASVYNADVTLCDTKASN